MKWKSNDGVDLFAHKWEPVTDGVRGALCLVHGLGEHCGRYLHWAEKLTGAGYALLSFDLRGHGRSGGARGHTPGFDHIADDIEILLEKGKTDYPGVPRFLYGHSLGGLLVLHTLLQRRPTVTGAVVTSPTLETAATSSRLKAAAILLLARLVPRLAIPNGLDRSGLSRDPEVVKAYENDPLVHDRISMGMTAEMIKASRRAYGEAKEIKTPLLLMSGGEDRITLTRGSEKLAGLMGEACAFKFYPGCYHELHNEPEKDQVFADLLTWMNRLN